MKKNIIRRYIKPYVSLVIAGMLMLTACGQVAEADGTPDETSYTQEEIEDRIRHVGRRYDGLDDGNDFSFLTGGYSTAYNGGMVMEAAAEADDWDSSAVSQSTVINNFLL